METEEILSHYARDCVQREISRYSRGRWVAIHLNYGASPRMVRYRYADGAALPLRIEERGDVERIVRAFGGRIRSFYATIHRYDWSGPRPSRILSSMPSWDIDLLVDEVEPALKAAADLISTLERYGVTKSIIVKWSGQGVHIHVNDQAFSPSLFEAWSPLDVAYAVTEFIMGRCGEHGSSVKVENKVDPGRVFTSPLSLHREVDRVCVCIPPDEVLSFAAEWASPKSFRHYFEWDGFEPGEADALAITALETIGPYPGKMKRKRLHPPLDYEIDRLLKRFGKGDACTTHRA
ncbi:MAG: hypothetical protein QW580_05570 [Nitrososphaerota archaeon]